MSKQTRPEGQKMAKRRTHAHFNIFSNFNELKLLVFLYILQTVRHASANSVQPAAHSLYHFVFWFICYLVSVSSFIEAKRYQRACFNSAKDTCHRSCGISPSIWIRLLREDKVHCFFPSDFRRKCPVLMKGFKGENFTPNLYARAVRTQYLRCE